MSELSTINSILQSTHPAAWRCLSDLGRRLYYPLGIPAQAQAAKNCTINATIGQITDGRNGALPLPAMVAPIQDLPAEQIVLYTTTSGNPQLRALWAHRLQTQGCGTISKPIVTQGLTHGLSIVADLFTDASSTVILPNPGWGNYQHIFGTRRGANIQTYRPVSREGLDLNAIDEALDSAPEGAVMVLNFPSNPIGYSPTLAEAHELAKRIHAHPRPLVVVTDDAYQGMVWEPGLQSGSLFPLLNQGTNEQILNVKVDGATKELFFFGGRVGFLTFGCAGEAAEVLEEKGQASIRTTISSACTLSQNLVARALQDPHLDAQTQVLRDQIRYRYERIQSALKQAGIECLPYNSAFFILIPVRQNPEEIRLKLIERGVGVISIPQASAIRLSYASVALEDIETLVRELNEVIG